jgi:hypothetical protein
MDDHTAVSPALAAGAQGFVNVRLQDFVELLGRFLAEITTGGLADISLSHMAATTRPRSSRSAYGKWENSGKLWTANVGKSVRSGR